MAGTDEGARALYELSKRMKRAGAADLRRQFHADMREAAKPLIPYVVDAAGTRFPTRGGLAKVMQRKSRYRAQARTGSATAGVRITAPRTDPRVDEQGRVAHPIFGRRGKPAPGKRNTAVTRLPRVVGFFSQTITDHAPEVRGDLEQRLTRWAQQFLDGVG